MIDCLAYARDYNNFIHHQIRIKHFGRREQQQQQQKLVFASFYGASVFKNEIGFEITKKNGMKQIGCGGGGCKFYMKIQCSKTGFPS